MLPLKTTPGLLLGSNAISPVGRGSGSVRSVDRATPEPSTRGTHLQRFLRLPLLRVFMAQRLTSRDLRPLPFFFFFFDFFADFLLLSDFDDFFVDALAYAGVEVPRNARETSRIRSR